MSRTGSRPKIVKGAVMVAQAMCPGSLTDARSVRLLPRVGGRLVLRQSAARRHEVRLEHEKFSRLVAVDEEHEGVFV